jgi:uncharacterized protein YyaL (SSP411 family)
MNQPATFGSTIALALALALTLTAITLTSMCASAGTPPPLTSPFTNHLIDSNDPYLLSHAHNPVDWYPWGPEALARAKMENKPIFVSIGYSSCYWCHVAEREIYSDPVIAKLMNNWFINIKIDREERPDLDSIYMDARQLVTGSGGWPNNLFLTPDLQPFFAGSYFPASDQAGGVPGFPTILRSMHDDWTEHQSEVIKQGDLVLEAMRERSHPSAGDATVFDAGVATQHALETIFKDMDWVHGGMDTGSSKFPRPATLGLLLTDYRATQNRKDLQALTLWLDSMALGGLRDPLDGGFYRYSTEPTWSIPHFEKMLYDNAQLLNAYCDAYETTRSPLYARVATQLANYITSQLSDPLGGFFSSQDAEVQGREGANYLWTYAEIERVLSRENAAQFLKLYTLTVPPDDAAATASNVSEAGVLRVRIPLDSAFIHRNAGRLANELAAQQPARRRLLAARALRVQPARDEKIIIAWNALTIGALVRAAQVLHRPGYLVLASQAGERIWASAYDAHSGKLNHEIFRGRAQGQGFLDDYGLLGISFLDLAAASHQRSWQERATQLADALLQTFYNDNALHTTALSDLAVAPHDTGDDSLPSGTSAAVMLLSRLSASAESVGGGAGPGFTDYSAILRRVEASLGKGLSDHPDRWPFMLLALSSYPTLKPHVATVALNSANHVQASGHWQRGLQGSEIIVKFAIDAGYHANANPATFNYLIPTQLEIEGHPELAVAYPAASMIRPKFAPDGLAVYEGTTWLRIHVGHSNLLAEQNLTVDLTVQLCNDDGCLPPDTIQIPIWHTH